MIFTLVSTGQLLTVITRAKQIHDCLMRSMRYFASRISVCRNVVTVIQKQRLYDSSGRKARFCQPRRCGLYAQTTVQADAEKRCWRSAPSLSSHKIFFKPLVNFVGASVERVVCLCGLCSSISLAILHQGLVSYLLCSLCVNVRRSRVVHCKGQSEGLEENL